MRGVVSRAASAAVAVFFPISCAGCSTPDSALCGDCRRELQAAPSQQFLPGGTPVWAALPYQGVLRNVILQLKENNRTDIAGYLKPLVSAVIVLAERDAERDAERNSGRDAERSVLRAVGQPVQLICVPASAGAWRRRGYSPVELLVRRAGFAHARVLATTHGGSVQKSLTAAQRLVNRREAFRSRRPLNGRRFILIDDVLTTGATLGAAVEAIHGAGGEVVGVAVVAFTPRRNQRVSDFRTFS